MSVSPSDPQIDWATCRSWTVRDLRRRWKPFKEQLSRVKGHPLPIRMHRAFSWMDAADQLEASTPVQPMTDAPDDQLADQRLILRWIALNAFYGKWDAAALEPVKDATSLREFLRQIGRLDEDGLVAQVLTARRDNVVDVVSNRFIDQQFWRLLHQDRRFDARRSRNVIEKAYQIEDWNKIARELLNRIYLVRNQLVHGAATCNSKLNREVVLKCASVLRDLLVAFSVVIIDHGRYKDWGSLCYPPQNTDEPDGSNGQLPRKPR